MFLNFQWYIYRVSSGLGDTLFYNQDAELKKIKTRKSEKINFLIPLNTIFQVGKIAKKSSLKECVFFILKIQCQIIKNTLLQTTFSGICSGISALIFNPLVL